jgi:predicted DNA-binding WGR domain protein
MRLEFVGGGSSKFWDGRAVGSSVTVLFGRIGTAGQTCSTRFASPKLAKAVAMQRGPERSTKLLKSAICQI